jgi:hypothetical protein
MRVTPKISAETVGRAKCLVTVCAHLAGLKENITVNRRIGGSDEAFVIRAGRGDEGVARAAGPVPTA